MLIEAARRAEAAVKEMLAIANDGSATTDELRDGLRISKSFVGIASAFQLSAAAAVAGRERHGDGGAEVLAATAGLHRTEARSQVKAAEAFREVPVARDLVESGRVSPANAKRLAEAIDKAGAGAVAGDAGLLASAELMRPEQFSREARRWVVAREDDGGESEHRRQRARRHVRLRNAEDGMVHLYGEFDAATGQRVGNRLRARPAACTRPTRRPRQARAPIAERSPSAWPTPSTTSPPATQRAMARGSPSLTSAWSRTSTTRPAASSPSYPTATGCPRRCLRSSPATPSSPASSMTARASRSGALSPAAPPPKHSDRSSSPATAAASTVLLTPRCARSTTSGRYRRAGPQRSPTWSRSAGTATRGSTTTSGRFAPPTACTPCTRPGRCITDPPTRRRIPSCTCPASLTTPTSHCPASQATPFSDAPSSGFELGD